MDIMDGQGSGSKLGVNKEHQALVFGMVESELAAASRKGDAFSWQNATYDYDAADTILLVANESSDRELVIDKLIIGSDTATVCTIHAPAYPTLAGTTVTAQNLNRNSNKIAEASAICDETGNGQQAAAYTGRILTGHVAANGLVEVRLYGSLLLPYGWNVGIDLTADAGGGVMTIWGYFRDKE
jgi:hypothetical protein